MEWIKHKQGMHYLLIRNARLPKSNEDGSPTSILIAEGRIISIGAEAQHPLTDTTEIDASGCFVMPTLLSLCNPRPLNIDVDNLQSMNFENATAGVTSIMTVSPNIEDNISELRMATTPLLNYAIHLPLNQVTMSDSKRIYRLMVREGVATAMMRIGDERHDSPSEMAPHMTAAGMLGLRVLFDIRGLVDKSERIKQLKSLCEMLSRERRCMAYIIGIEYDEELNVAREAVGDCDIAAHISFDPFSQGKDGKLSADTIADTLRSNTWCSLGLAYSAAKAIKERWPDMTPEIVSRNKLPLLNALPSQTMLSPEELAEFAMRRPANLVGLGPTLGTVTEGASANLIVWNHSFTDDARFASPRGDIQDVSLRGKIDYVVMNGNIVVDDKFRPGSVCGRHLYGRIVK